MSPEPEYSPRDPEEDCGRRQSQNMLSGDEQRAGEVSRASGHERSQEHLQGRLERIVREQIPGTIASAEI
jgi:hypothetical protein